MPSRRSRDPRGTPGCWRPDRLDQGRHTVMLVASLQVAASKCCHAAAMPAGCPEPAAAGHDVVPDQVRPLLFAPRTRAAAAPDRPANPGRPRTRRFLAGRDDPLRLAQRRDEERTNTWNTSGMYRFFLLGTQDRGRGWRRRWRKRRRSMTGCGVSSEPHPRQDLDILQAGGTAARRIEWSPLARTSSSARCKWRIVIHRLDRPVPDHQYYALRRCFRDVHGEKRDLLPD